MTRFLLVTAAALTVALPTAAAQSTEAQRDAAREILVLSVVYHVDRYVYDVYDGNETEAVLYNSITSGLIVRSPQSKQRVMVVLEPDGQHPATSGPNALFLSPFDSVGQFAPRTADYLTMSDATTHTVHVFLCADDSDDPFAVNDLTFACRSWTEIGPISDSPGLTLVVLTGPEQGGSHNRPGDDG